MSFLGNANGCDFPLAAIADRLQDKTVLCDITVPFLLYGCLCRRNPDEGDCIKLAANTPVEKGTLNRGYPLPRTAGGRPGWL